MTTAASPQQPSSPSRRDNLERMLELEQRIKVNRMQASSYASHPLPLSHTNTDSALDSESDYEDEPPALYPNGRAMTTPNLSVTIPPMKESTKYVISQHGDIIPQEEEKEEGHDSDTSSICQSPGWDDITGSKKKKERKEREKEKKRKEKAKHLEAAKLHKAPPRKRLSKVAGTDRSSSAPPVPFNPDTQESMDGRKKPGDRARRGSIEIGFRTLMHAKRAISTPWRSAHATPQAPAEEAPPMPASNSGFIGGLKLRQSEEANTQDAMRKLKLALDGEVKAQYDDRDVAPHFGGTSSSTSIADSTAPISIYTESARTSSQWDSIYAHAAMLASAPIDGVIEDDTPMMERNIRKGRRSHPPTSRYFDGEEPRSRRDLSRSSNQSSFASDGSNAGEHPSSATSPITNRSSLPADYQDSQHSRSSSFPQHSRQHSLDPPVIDPTGNYAVGGSSRPRKSESRGRSIFNRSRSRARDGSNVRPGTGESSGKEGESRSFFSQNSSASQLHLGQTTESPTESPVTQRNKSSFGTSSGVKGFRNAARAAFSKHSGSVTSGSDAYQSSAEVLTPTPTRPQPVTRAATTDIASLDTTKPERILGESIPSTKVQDFAAPRIPYRRYAPQVAHKDLDNFVKSSSSSQISGRQRASSRSSSEEYSTPDEYSNITTPTMSRPHSEKGYFTKSEDDNVLSMGMSTSSIDQPKEPYLMSGAIPDANTDSGREDWSRTAMPMELTTDDEHGKKPTVESVPDVSSELNRKPSITRSVSTPELQDLSFLPALKHQALTPRIKEKSKNRKLRSTRAEKSTKNNQSSVSQELALPTSPTASSEGSSSASHLKNARLALPMKPSMQSPVHPGGADKPDHMAKMFVVCCSCKYFHDMPSKIYECMAKPDNIVRDANLGVSGVVSTAVKCPWCAHGMSTKCCSGYATVVYLREKLH